MLMRRAIVTTHARNGVPGRFHRRLPQVPCPLRKFYTHFLDHYWGDPRRAHPRRGSAPLDGSWRLELAQATDLMLESNVPRLAHRSEYLNFFQDPSRL